MWPIKNETFALFHTRCTHCIFDRFTANGRFLVDITYWFLRMEGAIFIILWFFLQIEKEYGGWNIE